MSVKKRFIAYDLLFLLLVQSPLFPSLVPASLNPSVVDPSAMLMWADEKLRKRKYMERKEEDALKHTENIDKRGIKTV